MQDAAYLHNHVEFVVHHVEQNVQVDGGAQVVNVGHEHDVLGVF